MTWRLSVLDLATMNVHHLAETRSVDDQVEWLNDTTFSTASSQDPAIAVAQPARAARPRASPTGRLWSPIPGASRPTAAERRICSIPGRGRRSSPTDRKRPLGTSRLCIVEAVERHLSTPLPSPGSRRRATHGPAHGSPAGFSPRPEAETGGRTCDSFVPQVIVKALGVAHTGLSTDTSVDVAGRRYA